MDYIPKRKLNNENWSHGTCRLRSFKRVPHKTVDTDMSLRWPLPPRRPLPSSSSPSVTRFNVNANVDYYVRSSDLHDHTSLHISLSSSISTSSTRCNSPTDHKARCNLSMACWNSTNCNMVLIFKSNHHKAE